MNIFIPSYGRANSISTHKLLGGMKWYVVVHDSSEFAEYAKRVPVEHLITSNVELGIARQRNWIMEHVVEEGEWFVFMDDNVQEFLRVDPALYMKDELATESFGTEFWRKRFEIPCTPVDVEAILHEICNKAKEIGACFAGMATTENHFFRSKKWRTAGFVCTKTAILKKTDLRFDETFYAKDDVDFSANQLNRYGKVLVNNFIYPMSYHHQPGGVGNKAARLAYTRKEAIRLVEKWPAILAPGKMRKGYLEEVRFR